MKRHTFAIVVCLALGALGPLSAQDLTITNARIVVANGTVIERGSIVVRAGKIVSAGPGGPSGASGRTIDAKGMTAMPGFIDAHRHINTGPNEKAQMQALLEAGYTTVLSGGGPADGNITLRDHIEKGLINGPRIIPSGSLRLNSTPRKRLAPKYGRWRPWESSSRARSPLLQCQGQAKKNWKFSEPYWTRRRKPA